jgi:hypothetical protein
VETSALAASAMREFLATDASNSVAQTRSLRYYYVRENLTLGAWGPD